MDLELRIQRLTLSSAHNLSLASSRLLERVQRLGNFRENIPFNPRFSSGKGEGENGSEDPSERDRTQHQSSPEVDALAAIKYALAADPLTEFNDIPLNLSRHLISLFLPYRRYYYFFMDTSRFLECISLPPSHPKSIHPCLLNACYLGASLVYGEAFSFLQPFFLRRTRYFLSQSLMWADRLTHFLWASVILGCYFARVRRMEECFAVVSPAARLASACGLRFNRNSAGGMDSESRIESEGALLPPPSDMVEAMDRIWLAYSVYITDQSMSTVTSFPATFPCDSWPPTSLLHLPHSLDGRESNLARIEDSNEHIMASSMKIFEDAKKFAHSICEKGWKGHEGIYDRLRDRISFHQRTLPSIPSPQGLRSSEAALVFNNSVLALLAHTTIYGSGLIVYSLRAGDDAEARGQMLKCVGGLVDLSEKVRAHKRLHPANGGIISMVHIMNAVRIIVHELQESKARSNANLSIHYCDIIGVLLDYLDDSLLRFPAWADGPISLKDKVATAASAPLI
ncbi:hypothetical protein DL93DRAFT_2168536 [Clavulina sp. PMI_390]|nr:hypothetical protein DL93DRAFT_2168536 [Clavulina sp. PMI_390]